MKIIVIHDGIKVLQVQLMDGHAILNGNLSFVVDDKETAIAIAELLNLDDIELIEDFLLNVDEE